MYECPLTPLGHRPMTQAMPRRQFLERSFRSLYRGSDGLRGRGAAVTYLAHSASRNMGSA